LRKTLQIVEKKCTKCYSVKSIDEFYKNKKDPSGYRSECKSCHNMSASLEFKNQIKEKKCVKCGIVKPIGEFYHYYKRYHTMCKSCLKAFHHEMNKDFKRKNTGDKLDQFRKDNPFRVCAKCGILKPIDDFNIRRLKNDGYDYYCKACKNKDKKTNYEKHKDLPSDEYAQWRKHRGEKSREESDRLKSDVFSHYCIDSVVKCQDPYHIHDCLIVTELHLLTLDHINGDGFKEKDKYGHRLGGRVFYRWLRMNNYPRQDLQVLCPLCQQEKVYRNKEYGGRYKRNLKIV